MSQKYKNFSPAAQMEKFLKKSKFFLPVSPPKKIPGATPGSIGYAFSKGPRSWLPASSR